MEGLISPEEAYVRASIRLAQRKTWTDDERLAGHLANECRKHPESAIYPDFNTEALREARLHYANGAGHMDTAIKAGIARAMSLFSTEEVRDAG